MKRVITFLATLFIILSITTKEAKSIELNGNLIWRTSFISFIGTTLFVNPLNATSFNIETGETDDKIVMYRLRLNFKKKTYFDGKLNLYISFAYGKWNNLNNYSDSDTNNVLDFNPFFSWKIHKNFRIDYSSGFSLFSSTKIGDRNFGGVFSFNHFIRLKSIFKKVNISAGLQHYSNNGIYYPNNGINFYFLSIGYRY